MASDRMVILLETLLQNKIPFIRVPIKNMITFILQVKKNLLRLCVMLTQYLYVTKYRYSLLLLDFAIVKQIHKTLKQ
jgi:hypothetical protein